MVYPLLDRGIAALPDREFTAALRIFLAQFDDPIVLADSALDFMILSHAINGFDRGGLMPAPLYRPMLVTFGEVLMRIEEHFETQPEARARRHHAGVDAEALRLAFEYVSLVPRLLMDRSGEHATGQLGARAAESPPSLLRRDRSATK